MKKYNVALLPVSKRKQFIAASQRFSTMDLVYNLSEKSLPHVTLCKFYREESEIAAIWEEICAKLSVDTLDLVFDRFSFTTFDNKMFWICLMPADVRELHKLQAEVVSILNVSSKKRYEPHLTLMSTLDPLYQSKAAQFIEGYESTGDTFTLALGESGELGQFVRVMYQKELPETIVLKK